MEHLQELLTDSYLFVNYLNAYLSERRFNAVYSVSSKSVSLTAESTSVRL